jgi:uncharacterized membrane protein
MCFLSCFSHINITIKTASAVSARILLYPDAAGVELCRAERQDEVSYLRRDPSCVQERRFIVVRITHYVFVAGAMLGVSMHLLAGMSDQDMSCETAEIKGEVLDQKLESYRKFQVEMNQTIAAIVDENLPLDRAVEQVTQAATQYFPEFLNNVKQLKGRNSRHDVSESIISYFVSALKDGNQALVPIVDRLRAEQVKLKAESDKTPAAKRQ